ncbi:MAG TPA: hypothetical protein VLE93_00565 [Candidatus Saccharimonadales bacterium]|nr:hypothetical protein [Candidatus Saccharimonadales bacterium]
MGSDKTRLNSLSVASIILAPVSYFIGVNSLVFSYTTFPWRNVLAPLSPLVVIVLAVTALIQLKKRGGSGWLLASLALISGIIIFFWLGFGFIIAAAGGGVDSW